MPRSSVAYEISPECIFYARGLHRDPEESRLIFCSVEHTRADGTSIEHSHDTRGADIAYGIREIRYATHTVLGTAVGVGKP